MTITINGTTGISGVDGSSGTPAYQGNDANTGISFGTDIVTINTGGTARVTTDASGNVGIGTSSPTFKLQIQSGASTILAGADSAATTLTDNTQKVMRFGVPHYTNAEEPVGALFVSNTISASALLIGGGTAQFNAATVLQFYTAANNTTVTGSERMRIDSSGNLGIGTSSPYSAAGAKTLQLTGSDYSLFEQSVTTATAGYQNWRQIVRGSVGGHVYQMQLMNDANSAEQTIYEVSRTGNSVDYQRWYGGTNEAMRITSAGNVGIGTTSPGGKLEVVGGRTFLAAASETFACGVRYVSTGGAFYFGASDGTATPDGVFSQAGGSERMRITNSGNVLVGTSTSSDNTNGAKLEPSVSAGYPTVLKIMKTASGGFNGLLNYHSGTYVGGINFDNTSTSFPTSSDIRLKKDIVDAPSATQKIDNIRIVSHGWKHDNAVVDFGIIAQELVSVAPNAVMQGDDGDEVVTTWSVDYSKLVPLLIKAIQELTARLEALENK